MKKPLSIALIVAGLGFIAWGFDSSGSFGNQVASTLTGAQTDEVMQRYIIGAVCLAIGGFLFFKK